MFKEIAIGLANLGVIGGIGTAGVIWGPDLMKQANAYMAMFKDVQKGESVKYTIKVDKQEPQILDCEGKQDQYTILKLEKVSDAQNKAKFICQTTQEHLDKSSSFMKTISGIKELSCIREESTGTKQTFRCVYPGKSLTLEANKEDQKVTGITISWS
ncbi:hypothetical protein MHLP_01370 [Candidatus Mycoplasma haematolamae str. Purdue]|uniref:Uncharacterized protein n=1 Tax=Mycoplasma haematolamae (strain Purdue) TaxID=1212765 RepID=I7CJ04_MYCHA|nr:hypothetical protein [Candidatus Mycoplasma haematolamae]AFO51854.1 hypothetical protein MHLP_01370 [Candidatus Mycoplasma haematolamae str. Purdue]